jgi:TetR/AcrR family transcriptional repressor of nem operon
LCAKKSQYWLRGAADWTSLARITAPSQPAQVFWIGWEGAVMRARLVQSAAPLNQYWDFFAHNIVNLVQN